jgi:hypothetical protein
MWKPCGLAICFFVSGMLPTEGQGEKFIERVGAELDVEAGCRAAHLAMLNVDGY